MVFRKDGLGSILDDRFDSILEIGSAEMRPDLSAGLEEIKADFVDLSNDLETLSARLEDMKGRIVDISGSFD